jgi:sugar lactone lactonase YvrE
MENELRPRLADHPGFWNFHLGYCFFLFSWLGACPAAYAENHGHVSTFAGTALPGSNNGTCKESSFLCPGGIAVDTSNVVYIADTLNNQIRKISDIGNVSILETKSGDTWAGGSATQVLFNSPSGVVAGSQGIVYVADSGNNLIRQVTRQGLVSTLAGTGPSGAANGPATSAMFNNPLGIAMDATGTIYVADSGNNLIRKIVPGGTVSTLAGSGKVGSANGAPAEASFNHPTGLAVDSNGTLYVSDEENQLIRKITPEGEVSTLAGSEGVAGNRDGPATIALFNLPAGIAVDSHGTLYVADMGNHLIRVIRPDSGVTTLAGSGKKGSNDGSKANASFKYPQGVAVDRDGKVFVADTGNSLIREIQ